MGALIAAGVLGTLGTLCFLLLSLRLGGQTDYSATVIAMPILGTLGLLVCCGGCCICCAVCVRRAARRSNGHPPYDEVRDEEAGDLAGDMAGDLAGGESSTEPSARAFAAGSSASTTIDRSTGRGDHAATDGDGYTSFRRAPSGATSDARAAREPPSLAPDGTEESDRRAPGSHRAARSPPPPSPRTPLDQPVEPILPSSPDLVPGLVPRPTPPSAVPTAAAPPSAGTVPAGRDPASASASPAAEIAGVGHFGVHVAQAGGSPSLPIEPGGAPPHDSPAGHAARQPAVADGSASGAAAKQPGMSVRQMRSELDARGIAHEHCLEKSELAALLARS